MHCFNYIGKPFTSLRPQLIFIFLKIFTSFASKFSLCREINKIFAKTGIFVFVFICFNVKSADWLQ